MMEERKFKLSEQLETVHDSKTKGQEDDSDYDPDEFQNKRKFTVAGGNTIKEVQPDNKKFIETDIQFVDSVRELCWQRFGIGKESHKLSDEDCSRMHTRAQGYSEKNAINNTKLICEDLLKVEYLTYDTAFFFFFMKVLFVCALLMTLGFAVPAMIKYGQGSRYLTAKLFNCQTSFCQFIDRYSMYNTQDPTSVFTLLEWLGFGFIFLLQLVFFFSWQCNKQIREVVKYEQRCSECSLLIRRLPEGEYGERDVLNFVQKKYHEAEEEKRAKGSMSDLTDSTAVKIHEIKLELSNNNHFGIKAVQIIYDFREEKQMVQDIIEHSKEIVNFFEEGTHHGEKVTFLSDHEKYKSKKQQISDLYHKLREHRRIFLEDEVFRKSRALDSVLLHFNTQEEKNTCLKVLQKYYQTQWIISWGNFEPCQRLNKPVEANPNVLDNINLRVGLAPEPQNIIWSKVEHTYEEWLSKYAGCKILMVLVPLMHVGIIIGLQCFKVYVLQSESSINNFLSFVATILIIVSNQVLWIFLELAVGGQEQRLVTAYEVYINYAGFAANALSIIVAPVIVNYWFKGIYFGSSSLVGEVFQYQMSATLTIPFLMIVAPPEAIKLFILKIDCIRNWLIRLKFQKEQGYRTNSVYQFYQFEQFNISDTYSFLMSNFLHATCFCMLTPAIIPLYCLQIFVLYWSCKIRIMKFCKFPRLIRRWLLGIVYANLMVSPLFFAGGFLLSEHAFKDKVADFNHIPVALYLFFAWEAVFAVIALLVDRWLTGKKLFSCMVPVSTINSLEELQLSRGKQFPSKSSSYYVGNNMMCLFGYRKAIIGTVRNKRAQQLHKTFCQTQFLLPNRIQESKKDK